MTKDPEVLTLTYQKETRDPESETWSLEDLTVSGLRDPEKIRDFLREKERDRLSHNYYVTVFSGDPKDPESEIVSVIPGEEYLRLEDWRDWRD